MAAGKPIILLLEDDPASAEALSLVLSDWGAEVAHGADGPSADVALGARTASWIITDYHLGPGPDGVALAQRFAAGAPDARVLVLTAFCAAASAAAAEAGFALMGKPAPPETILAWLERG